MVARPAATTTAQAGHCGTRPSRYSNSPASLAIADPQCMRLPRRAPFASTHPSRCSRDNGAWQRSSGMIPHRQRTWRSSLQRLSELMPSPPSWVDEAREQLRGLNIRELNTLRPEAAPPRATGQLMSMVQYLKSAPAIELAPIAHASIAGVAATLTATAARTHKELSGKDWVISHGAVTETHELLWQPTHAPHDPPRLATALDRASAIAAPHAETPSPPEPTRAAALLEDVLTPQRRQRPDSPGQRPEDDTAVRLRNLRQKLANERTPAQPLEGPSQPTQGPTQGI